MPILPYIGGSGLSSAAARVRAPKVWLQVSGGTIPCETASVTRKSLQAADEFEATLGLDISAQYGMPASAWADFQGGSASILMATSGSDQTTMVTGQIEIPKIDWTTMTVQVHGHDASAPMAEQRRSQKFQNMTSSDIVSQIASAYGLSPAVTSTSDFAGKIYTQDVAHLVMNRSDFEILNDLANRENYRWYVDGQTLYFEPKETDSDVFSVTWNPSTATSFASATVLTLETWRDMRAAQSQQTTMQSFHPWDAKVYQDTQTAPGIGSDFVANFHHNGKNQAQVEALNKNRLDDLVRHDCNCRITAPADLTVTARMKLSLSGTGTIYDQQYDIDTIHFELSNFESGAALEMTIDGKSSNGRGTAGGGGGDGGSGASPSSTLPSGVGETGGSGSSF